MYIHKDEALEHRCGALTIFVNVVKVTSAKEVSDDKGLIQRCSVLYGKLASVVRFRFRDEAKGIYGAVNDKSASLAKLELSIVLIGMTGVM